MDNIPRIGDNVKDREYSLAQFKKDYRHIMRREVFPKLKPFEKKRLKYCYNLNIAFVILLAIIVAVFLFLYFSGCLGYKSSSDIMEIYLRLSILAFAGYFWVRHHYKKKLENEIKIHIMPLLMKAIPGFRWTLEGIISQGETENVDLFPYNSGMEVKSDDNFEGQYRGVNVAITESNYSYMTGSGKHRRKVVVFNGAIARIKMNKRFEGITVIRPKFNTSIQNKLEKVKLEDREFHKHFTVFSTDQIEARYLLTTAFMERFKNIQTAFKTNKIFCSFCGDNIYIAPYAKGDLFSLAHLSKTLIDEEQYEILFKEFASILALVDHFKLDKKLGL